MKKPILLSPDAMLLSDFLRKGLGRESSHFVTAAEAMTNPPAGSELLDRSATAAPRPGEPVEKLSRVLLKLAERCQGHSLRLGEVVEATQGRGYNLLLIILVLPFLTPVSLPFISTPFGLAAAFIGLRMALGQKPVFSQWLRMKPLPPRLFPRLLRAGSRVLGWLEYFLKPRLAFVHKPVFFQRVTGALIAISGTALLLPLPIPLTNFFPALTILLLAAAALERDGCCFIAGWLTSAVTGLYFILLGFGGTQIVDQIRQTLMGG